MGAFIEFGVILSLLGGGAWWFRWRAHRSAMTQFARTHGLLFRGGGVSGTLDGRKARLFTEPAKTVRMGFVTTYLTVKDPRLDKLVVTSQATGLFETFGPAPVKSGAVPVGDLTGDPTFDAALHVESLTREIRARLSPKTRERMIALTAAGSSVNRGTVTRLRLGLMTRVEDASRMLGDVTELADRLTVELDVEAALVELACSDTSESAALNALKWLAEASHAEVFQRSEWGWVRYQARGQAENGEIVALLSEIVNEEDPQMRRIEVRNRAFRLLTVRDPRGVPKALADALSHGFQVDLGTLGVLQGQAELFGSEQTAALAQHNDARIRLLACHAAAANNLPDLARQLIGDFVPTVIAAAVYALGRVGVLTDVALIQARAQAFPSIGPLQLAAEAAIALLQNRVGGTGGELTVVDGRAEGTLALASHETET